MRSGKTEYMAHEIAEQLKKIKPFIAICHTGEKDKLKDTMLRACCEKWFEIVEAPYCPKGIFYAIRKKDFDITTSPFFNEPPKPEETKFFLGEWFDIPKPTWCKPWQVAVTTTDGNPYEGRYKQGVTDCIWEPVESEEE